jgi:hypothetical protein
VRARGLWIVISVAVLVGIVAWSTTCTGPRPRPTGETLPSTDTTTTLVDATTTVPPPL